MAVATVDMAATVVLLWMTTTTVVVLLAATALAVTTTVAAPLLLGTTTTHATTARPSPRGAWRRWSATRWGRGVGGGSFRGPSLRPQLADVVDGEVEMVRNYALEPEEVEQQFVLTCQTFPVSDAVTVDFDA